MYLGCGAKIFAAYPLAVGVPLSSKAAKLIPRSTIKVCRRLAMTCPNPIRRMVSNPSHASIRTVTGTFPTSTVRRQGASWLSDRTGADPTRPAIAV